MTANQIAYARAQEEKRHNRAVEKQAANELAETSRANLEREANNRYVTEETNRHNLVVEGTNTILAKETKRSNLAKEAENYRSNTQKERENYRHNRSTEDLGVYELAEKREVRSENARQFEAQQNLRDATFAWQKFLDDWNQQNTILYRDEQRRHNLAQESIGFGNLGVGWAQAAASQAQAAAAQSQAAAAMRNAATNEVNAATAYARQKADEGNIMSSLMVKSQEAMTKQQDADTRQKQLEYQNPFGKVGAGIEWTTRNIKNLADILKGVAGVGAAPK